MSLWDVSSSETRHSSGRKRRTPSSGGIRVKMRGEVANRCTRLIRQSSGRSFATSSSLRERRTASWRRHSSSSPQAAAAGRCREGQHVVSGESTCPSRFLRYLIRQACSTKDIHRARRKYFGLRSRKISGLCMWWLMCPLRSISDLFARACFINGTCRDDPIAMLMALAWLGSHGLRTSTQGCRRPTTAHKEMPLARFVHVGL